MTDISKEAIAEAWEEFEICARPTGSDGDLDLYDVDGMQEHAYTLHQIAAAQAARIDQLTDERDRQYEQNAEFIVKVAGLEAALATARADALHR